MGTKRTIESETKLWKDWNLNCHPEDELTWFDWVAQRDLQDL